ncbi:conserved hypothetical protein [Talaromyces stipitatus ATCC 10500]|uniref:Uncharacterized protein n=1 Tax=Talaromyces stipitatus (strain ATCC 10500 / CBS 375.48 / QM 6759 / NRRL 1006) TaxID=441959 RepID=B8MER7_TALSN|nr:uncharacterized protein TSTA_020090 [Talaromyces stipitatus ATCC 10500]EED16950.1 conserved hypothetical protein [Talaromyces stipitatus ATCC 10500]
MQSSNQQAILGSHYTSPLNSTNTVALGDPDSIDGNLRMPLLLFTDDEADTLVYIEPGPQPNAEPTNHQSRRWVFGSQEKVQAIPHRIHSRKLLDTGSEVLKDLFRPRTQARVRKRYGLTDNMSPGVKYAIDLTPPSEGDEAVIFMTELSCPMGVRRWSQMQSRWSLPTSCVSGQDEIEWILTEIEATRDPIIVESEDATTLKQKRKARRKEAKQQAKQEEKQAKANDKPEAKAVPRRVMNFQGNLPTLRADLDPMTPYSESEESTPNQPKELQEPEIPKKTTKRLPGLPLDYSPIRHRTGLERLLHAIEGLDPKLDTAPKLWTYFALAKILKVATHPAVGDHILVWLYTQSNTMFIEVNPELAYQIACGLQNRALCQTSFAILVGEESLMVLDSLIDSQVPKRRARTIHGRFRESLDDTEVQRVEYASKVFLDRILNEFVKLAGTRMEWVEDILRSHFTRVWWIDLAPHKQAIDELAHLCKLFPSTDTMDYPGIDYYAAHSVLPRFCRVLTRGFWKSLAMILPTPTEAHTWACPSLRDLAPALSILEDEGNAIIRHVSTEELYATLDKFYLAAEQLSFDFSTFTLAVGNYLDRLASRIAGPPQYEQEPHSNPFEVPFEIVDTLVCLQDEEFKFLPLWAGGNDDGTGGVFDDHSVPILEEGGFSTAGPSVRLGNNAQYPDDVASMDSFESIRPDEAASTVQRASHEATASHATTTTATVVSATMSTISEFELVGAVQDLDIRSTNGSVMADDDTEMKENVDEDEFDFFDDDDDNDTIGNSPDLE